MNIESGNIENILFDYVDKVKVLLSADLWQNILLNCTKNELFTILLIYRKEKVNMTQIAEYIQVPLNTATGIVARMEKKGIVYRMRSLEDKRVVTIELSEEGKSYFKNILNEMFHEVKLLIDCCTPEELQTLLSIIDRFVDSLANEKKNKEKNSTNGSVKIRKIQID